MTHSPGSPLTSAGISQQDVIYEEQVPCTVISPNQEDRTRNIRMRISLVTRGTQRCYLFRFTDDTMLQFLYMASIDEAEFPRVKETHHLNVDFNGFSQFISGFLERCRSQENWIAQFSTRTSGNGVSASTNGGSLSPSSHLPAPRSVHSMSASSLASSMMMGQHAQEDTPAGMFTVIERDQFSDCRRYSLQFTAGSNAQIQEYLCGLVVDWRRKAEEGDQARESMQKQMHSLATAAENAVAERELMRSQIERQRVELEQKYNALCNEIRSESVARLEALSNNHEEQRKTLEDALRQDLGETRAKLEQLMAKSADQFSTVTQQDARIRDLTSINDSLKRQLESSLEDAESLRKDGQATKTKLAETEQKLREVELRQSVLAQQVSSGAENTGTLKELLETANARTRDVEHAHNATKEMLQRTEDALRRAAEEITKANEIIKKKNGQLDALKHKVETKTQVSRQQEDRITKLEEELRGANTEKSRMVQQMRDKDVTVTELRLQLEKTSDELKKCREMLEESNRVVQWLNGELSKSQMVPFSSGAFGKGTVGSPSALGAGLSMPLPQGGSVAAGAGSLGNIAFSPPSQQPVSGSTSAVNQNTNSTASNSTITPMRYGMSSHHSTAGSSRHVLESISMNTTAGLTERAYRPPSEYAKITERFLSPSLSSSSLPAVSSSLASDPDAIAAEYLPRAS